MNTLIIRHITGREPASFQVFRLKDGKSTPKPSVIPSPVGFPVKKRPNTDLMNELRWYLETFLDYPFPPLTDVADDVQDALRKWGEDAFDALFGNREGGRMFDGATKNGYKHLHLQISSDDPRVLAWPWEALHDHQAGFLAQTCQIERRLNDLRDPVSLSDKLPRDQVNILLVTARPYKKDVTYRSISRPLVELIEKHHLPAQVHVLRPPTLDNLREHLRTHRNFYHILHFDGHGAYTELPADGESSGYTFRGPEGCLIFENRDGEPDPVRAEQLSSLLREYAVPAVVMNACQSGMIDEYARNAFASVASSFLQAGIRSVVAMAYSLYVSGAQTFLPAFYRRLFENGDMAQAARAGRQEMFAHPERICARGRFPLGDWLVPVVYQQEPLDFSFARQAKKKAASDTSRLPEEVREEYTPYGFIGRDGPLLELERAMRGRAAAILIHGLGGVGKTTLANSFVKWLNDTDGLGESCFWFGWDRENIRNAEYVINRMGERIFGDQFAVSGTIEEKISALAKVFRERRFLIVWDNCEVVRGIPGTSVDAYLSGDDRELLLRFLRELRGGETKVIVTSRSEEDWLGIERRKIGIHGLEGEERWAYLDEILREPGIKIDREDENLAKLMEMLDGHPLSMRVILPALERESPEAVAAALQSNLHSLDLKGDEAHERLHATLKFAENSLPSDLRPLLVPLALHERFVHMGFLEGMLKEADAEQTREQIDRFCETLVTMGLLHVKRRGIFELHPALTGYLRMKVSGAESETVRDRWAHAFTGVMGTLADNLAPRHLHEQRDGFHIFGASFYHAMNEAERLGMDLYFRALLQALAVYAQNIHNYKGAADLFHRLAEANKASGNKEHQATAYHQLGNIAYRQRDFETAEKWYRKSLVINEKQGNEHGAAATYHQLGMIAEEQRDFETAEKWYRKSLVIKEKQSNEHDAAATYHHLGRIAQEQRDFETAEKWHRKSLIINEKQGNEHGAAATYHQLGMIAQEQRDFETAEKWSRKSLVISEKQGNEHGAAATYHQLGMIAQEQRDFETAEKWCRKSLVIEEKQGNEHGAASTYHQLGMIAEKQRDFETAEKWSRKSLVIKEKQSNEHGTASIYHQLGIIAQEQRDFETAEKWFRKSLDIKEKQGNEHGTAPTYHNLGAIAQEQRDFETAEKWYRKSLVIEEKQGNEHSAAPTYHQLGMIAQEQRDFETAEKWYRKSLDIDEKQGNEHGAAQTNRQLGRIAQEQRDFETAKKWYRKSLDIFKKQGNEHGAASTYHQLGMIAQEQRDFETAEKWYRKSLDIFKKQGNEHAAATTYHNLGAIAQEQRDFETAKKWFRRSLDIFEKQGNEHGAATTYLQLGRIAQEQRDFETAEKWYRKSLDIDEKQGNEHGAATTYHQLGRIAQEQRDFETAKKWCRKSLIIEEKQGNEHGAAPTYHQLGMIAQEQRDFETAKKWYRKSLDIDEKQSNEHGTATTYHNLGAIAQEQRDFETAKKWYRKSLDIFKKQGNEHGAASTYHQLGMIAQEQRDFETAEKWYRKSLVIKEKQGNEHGTAQTYHELGNIAYRQRDFETAEKWYRKSLVIKEKQGNEHGAAITYHQLGMIAQEQRDFETAEKWCRKSLIIEEKQGNEHGAATTYHQLGKIAREQRDFETAEKWCRKSLAIKKKQGDEHGAATTYHELGIIAFERRDFETAEKWCRKSLDIKEKQGDEHGAASTYHELGIIARKQRDFKTAEKWYRKSLDISEKQGNEHGAALTYGELGILAGLQENFEELGKLLIKSLLIFARYKDSARVEIVASRFLDFYKQADPTTQTKLKALWEAAGLGELNVSEPQINSRLTLIARIKRWLTGS